MKYASQQHIFNIFVRVKKQMHVHHSRATERTMKYASQQHIFDIFVRVKKQMNVHLGDLC